MIFFKQLVKYPRLDKIKVSLGGTHHYIYFLNSLYTFRRNLQWRCAKIGDYNISKCIAEIKLIYFKEYNYQIAYLPVTSSFSSAIPVACPLNSQTNSFKKRYNYEIRTSLSIITKHKPKYIIILWYISFWILIKI